MRKHSLRLGMLVAVALVVLVDSAAHAQATRPATNPNLPTLFIVGDSTVRTSGNGQQGWGDPIAEFFDRKRINVVNRARGGRSSRTYQTEGLWEAVLAEIKPGDFVLMQFGHNDGIAPDDAKRPRGTLRGSGEETREITHPQTKQQEVVHTFGWYMRKYVRDAKARGATPIVCSYIPRCPRPGGTPIDPDAPPTSYALWAKESAEAEGAAFVDLHGLVLEHYATMTPEQVKEKYFTEADFTHTSAAGARRNAEAVVEGIRGLKHVALADYLTAAAVK